MRRFSALMGCRVLAGALLLGGAIAGANSGLAETLDKDACAKLTTERQSLATMGVEQNMAKGPKWASANLPASGLDLIKRYITIDEQIKFRCRAEPVAAEPVAAPAAEEKPQKPAATAAKASLARSLPATAKAAPAKAAGIKAAPAKTAGTKAAGTKTAGTKAAPAKASAATQQKPKSSAPKPASANARPATKSAATINATVN
jgi:hypothetical protein